MIRLLQFLIFGHAHKWVEDKRVDLFADDGPGRPYGTRVMCHCETCGKPKRFDLA